MSGISRVIKKPPLPTLFIDTSIINNIAKYLNNELSDERYIKLYKKLLNLILNKKLICPNANQDEEYLIVDRLNEICYEVLHRLSNGLRFLHHTNVEYYQYNTASIAYADNLMIVTFSYSEIIDDNINDYLNDERNIFIATTKTNYRDLYKNIKKDDIIVTEKWNELKSKNENNTHIISFEEQLEREYQGEIETIDTMLVRIKDPSYSIEEKQNYLNYISYMLKRTNKLFDINIDRLDNVKMKMSNFCTSEYYKLIPQVEISCKINAFLLTSYKSKVLKSSDQMDIIFISSYLPYCNMMIIDSNMKDTVEKLTLDKIFDTKVYSIKNFDKIMEYLASFPPT